MKYQTFAFLICFFAQSSNAQLELGTPLSNLPFDTAFVYEINKNLPAFTFKLHFESENDDSCNTLKISTQKRPSGTDSIQKIEGINIRELLHCNSSDNSYAVIKFDDVNFDGYDDLLLIRGIDCDKTDETWYDIWLYNSETKKFELNRDFNEKLADTYEKDYQNKLLIATSHPSNDFEEFYRNTYKTSTVN